MKQVIVQPKFWQLFPNGQINILVATNIDNTSKPKDESYFKQLLQQATRDAQQFLGAEPFSKNSVVEQWRQALTQFKTKKGARSSIEALLKRVDQEREFLPINPLVDLYNSVSLRFGVPCGGEDIDTIQGDLQLGEAKGGEPFFPLGAEKDAPALAGEICYFDDVGAVCRCLNWREAQRTMLTEQTRSVVLVIESINEQQIERSNRAQLALKELIEQYFKVAVTLYQLTSNNPTCIISE